MAEQAKIEYTLIFQMQYNVMVDRAKFCESFP